MRGETTVGRSSGRRQHGSSRRHTLGRLIGLGFVIAALSTGAATAAGSTPRGPKAEVPRLQDSAQVSGQTRGSKPQGLQTDETPRRVLREIGPQVSRRLEAEPMLSSSGTRLLLYPPKGGLH
jgi:hypothetical protein